MAVHPLDVRLADLAAGAVRTVRPSMSLRAAATALSEDVIGLAVVEQPAGVMAGVVSERDIVAAIADNADLDQDRVSDIMVDDVITMGPDETLRRAAEQMATADVRHLVVVDPDQGVVAVVSARDVMRAVVADDVATPAPS